MAPCKDPSLTFLNNKGYNVVRLPRVGLDPLDVLGKDTSVERLGSIDQMWSSQAAMPTVKGPLDASSVAGQKTSELTLSVGLKILSAALGAMGAMVPEVSFAYSRARKVTFTYTDVKSFEVDALAVGAFLSEGDLASNNPIVRHYFDNDDASAFIVTDVLKSKSLTVTALDDNKKEVAVDLPAIQQAVGAKVAVTSQGSSNSSLTYAGSELLAFGFKCFGIAFADGKWQVFNAKPSAALAFALPGAGGSGTLLGEGRIAVR